MSNYGFNDVNSNNGVNYTNNRGSAPDYTLWLILGILQICSLCCCNCITSIFGIITTVLVVNANNYFKIGDMNNYQNKMRTAKIINIIGWVIVVGGIIILLTTGIFSSLLNMSK